MSIRRIKVIGLLLCAIAVSSCVVLDAKSASKKLNPGLTEQEVIQRVGTEPSRTELQTCGGKSSTGEWQCKIYVYGRGYNELRIYFGSGLDGIWRVNSWN